MRRDEFIASSERHTPYGVCLLCCEGLCGKVAQDQLDVQDANLNCQALELS